jgi:hypothetical protein
MKNLRFVCFSAVLIVCLQHVSGQGFANLNFDQSTIVTSQPSGGGWDTGTANVPGWAWTPTDSGYTNIMFYNSFALSGFAVNLVGTNFGATHAAIQGKYSIYIQGADYNGGFGATIAQTGQIPLDARSITYWGGNFQVSFDGHPLSFIDVSNALRYVVWEADISAYAGQTGELLFSCGTFNAGMLDNIQFSSLPIPEPGILGMFGLGGLCFLFYRKNRS